MVHYCGAVCFYPVYNFEKFISFGLGTVRSETIKGVCARASDFFQTFPMVR